MLNERIGSLQTNSPICVFDNVNNRKVGFLIEKFRLFCRKEEALELGLQTRVMQQGEMHAFISDGFWQSMDTQRDRELLEVNWNEGMFS